MLDDIITRIKENNANSIADAVHFLEENPIFFRSGYLKEEILKTLQKNQLSQKQIQIMNKILIQVVKTETRREFRRYCHFAKKISSPELIHELKELSQSENVDIARRARWMLEGITPHTTGP